MPDSAATPTTRPPSADAWGPGVTMAVLVHVALIIALAFGVNWRSSEPAGIEAELWAAVPQAAAPKIEAPPKPEPPPPPPPQVKPEPPPPPPPPKVVEPPQPTEAEIALEKARQEQLRQEQEAEQQRREREEERKRQQAEAQKQKEAAEREAQRKREEEERQLEERRLAKQRVLEEQRLAKERAAEEQRLAKERAADEQRLAKQREENLNKMLAQAGGGSGGTGSAERSAGPSSGYAGRIVARVKPNILFGDEVAGNPAALVEVRAAPDGTIVARRLVRSSGVKAWDDAVLRAIDRTETLPRDNDGRVPPTIEIQFRPHS